MADSNIKRLQTNVTCQYAQHTAVYYLVVAVKVANAHYAYIQRNGQAEL